MKPNKSLFIQWAIINAATIGVFSTAAILAWSYLCSLPVIGICFLSIIILVYIFIALYGASLTLSNQPSHIISYESNIISFWAYQCTLMGLIGAVTGISYALNGAVGHTVADKILEGVRIAMGGAGIAWVPTIAGMAVCMSLSIQAFYIKHGTGRLNNNEDR